VLAIVYILGGLTWLIIYSLVKYHWMHWSFGSFILGMIFSIITYTLFLLETDIFNSEEWDNFWK
jgi:hypothetical protein